jgi:hypothetical protein
MADLAHGHGVKRKVESRRDLGGDGDASTRETDYDGVAERGLLERGRESPTSILPIAKQRLHVRIIRRVCVTAIVRNHHCLWTNY